MSQRKKIRLGDLLVENKMISQAQLDTALSDQKKTGRKIGKVLIENGYLSEEEMLQFLSRQLKMPFVDLLHFNFNPEIVKLIPEMQARRFRAIALKKEKDGVLVGMSDPTNIFAYDELSRILGEPVVLAVVRESELLKTIDTVYRRTDEISGFAEQLSDELTEGDLDLAQLVEAADVAEAPVVKLIQSLFEDALQVRASDIHIEPDETVLRIRQRVDGVLQEQVMDEVRIASALVLRLKLICGLDISEKRLPQDGRFSIRVKERNIDVRLSTMPVQHGESVVMRLLDQSSGVFELSQLGMPEDLRKRFEVLVRRPHGMVLVTGPTGSGKTTTLYAALQALNTPETKIITVEDPVEYRLPRINQVQVNTGIGLTFARVLRTSLRQDPDIILVGEMRDEETAEIGLRAAMTGHMVLSTLHTNDAISTINRMMDIGIKNYMLASALHAILAQRLVRRVCASCAEPIELGNRERLWLERNPNEASRTATYMQGRGCSHCNHSGYSGRIGVYELLEMDQKLSDVLSHGDSAQFALKARQAEGFKTLASHALEYAMQGITTIDEVLRISADVDTLVDDEAVMLSAPLVGHSLEIED